MTSFMRIWDLIKRLNQLSQEGKLEWATTASEGTYQVSFPYYALDIREPASFDGQRAHG